MGSMSFGLSRNMNRGIAEAVQSTKGRPNGCWCWACADCQQLQWHWATRQSCPGPPSLNQQCTQGGGSCERGHDRQGDPGRPMGAVREGDQGCLFGRAAPPCAEPGTARHGACQSSSPRKSQGQRSVRLLLGQPGLRDSSRSPFPDT